MQQKTFATRERILPFLIERFKVSDSGGTDISVIVTVDSFKAVRSSFRHDKIPKPMAKSSYSPGPVSLCKVYRSRVLIPQSRLLLVFLLDPKP